VPQECSEAVADLIAACMEADPADRPSAKDVVEMLSQQVEKPVAGSRRSARKQVGLVASGRPHTHSHFPEADLRECV
jgi:hypothetical protein